MTFYAGHHFDIRWPFQKWPDVFRGPAPVQDFQILGQNIAPIGLIDDGAETSGLPQGIVEKRGADAGRSCQQKFAISDST